ncbi:MAG: endonuclease MutS2 [Bacteroidetes bacterium]|nr:MAG: endonuclease MutS2 [Bacteroidota bacterium]
MHLEPKDLFEKLEFDKIIHLLEGLCLGELGQARARNLSPATELATIDRQLREVSEYKRTYEQNDPFPISSYFSISEDLRMLEVENYVLSEDALKRIHIILRFVQGMFDFFKDDRRETYPALFDIIRHLDFDKSLADAIEKVLDEKGEIRPDASPELQRIRKAIISKHKELDQVFRRLINDYRNRGWLTDNVESFRNGRRVLSVPAEHKRKIRGIIHDESTTGRTAFIEPEPVIDINNDIFDFQTEEKREIYRILKELSATLRPYAPVFRQYEQLIAQFDLIQAKARLASQMNGVMPRLIDRPKLGIQMGRHPLLYLKNKKIGKETVPFDLELYGNNRIVVLSGPNAGGKSILMKSVGLLQLMLQAGMLIPVDEISEMGIFEQFFADIGDQQSLEDDLSTYSSRLKNARIFLEKANDKTLVLIDEFGSGTDPKIGGAIAEAILLELNRKKVYGVITTHYSNLKMFAFKTPHIINGSMLFDNEHLVPTYQFKAGRPGSSYAFEIAKKSGLPGKILAYAKKRAGKNEKAVDELLIDLQREKKEVEDKLATLTEREKALERLIKNYNDLHRDLEYRRKKLKLEAKEQALQLTAQENRELERIVREIRESQNLEKAKKLAQQTRQQRDQLSESVREISEDLTQLVHHQTVKKGAISVGDYVRMKTGGEIGRVEALHKNKAIVQIGMMNMTVPVHQLVHAREPLKVQSKSIQTDTIEKSAQFKDKIDIRGLRMEEALKVVEDFVDQALVSSANHLRIVHGKGNGTLRKLVKMKLKEYDAIARVYHPEPHLGGDGVTIVEFG